VGQDAKAKTAVKGSIAEAWLDAVDAGPLRNTRLFEPLDMRSIDLAVNEG
jgi:predicted dinucleotide-binding enzyme